MKKTKKETKETKAVKSTAKAKVTKELTFEEKVLKELASIKRKLASVASDVDTGLSAANRIRDAIDPLTCLIMNNVYMGASLLVRDKKGTNETRNGSLFYKWVILARLGLDNPYVYKFCPMTEDRLKYDLKPENTQQYTNNYLKWCDEVLGINNDNVKNEKEEE